jgi:hypothetical protein
MHIATTSGDCTATMLEYIIIGYYAVAVNGDYATLDLGRSVTMPMEIGDYAADEIGDYAGEQ